MAIEAGTKFLGIASSVDTKERRSKRINDKSEYHTIEELTSHISTEVQNSIEIPEVTADNIVSQLDADNFLDIAGGLGDIVNGSTVSDLQRLLNNTAVININIVPGNLVNGQTSGANVTVYQSSLKLYNGGTGNILILPTNSSLYSFSYDSANDVLQTAQVDAFSEFTTSIQYKTSTNFVEDIYLTSNKIVIKVQDMDLPGTFDAGPVKIYLTQYSW